MNSTLTVYNLLLFTWLISVQLSVVVAKGPWCFKCDGAYHPAACREVATCGDHEYCYTERSSNNNGAELYSSGCKAIADCPTVVKRSPTVHCTECCNTTLCNEATCQAQSASNKTRLWCASCTAQKDPSNCDQVDLCSQDEVCSVASHKGLFPGTIYNLKCQKETECTNKTLAADQEECCDTHLCNTNLAFVSPDAYTSPPPPTTTPTPVAATASIKESDPIDFVSHGQANETLHITCIVGGSPTPNVTWFFYPQVDSTNGTSGNNNVTTVTTTAISGATGTTTAVSGATGTTTAVSGATGTTTAVSGATGSNSNGATSTSTNSTPAPSGVRTEITSGVVTSGNISTLSISSPNSSDAGTYVCHVENSLAKDDGNVTVTFAVAPTIDGIDGASNGTISASARDDVILDCEADGEPQPDVEWQIPQDAGGVEKLLNGSLLLHNVHGDNNGDYVCQANNSVGVANKTFTLDVDDNSTTTCATPAALTTTSVLTTLPSPSTTTTTTTQTTPTSTTSTTATSTTTTPTNTTPTTTTPTTTTDSTTTLTTTTTAAGTTTTTAAVTPLVCPTLPPTTTPVTTGTSSTHSTTTPTTPTTTSATSPTTASTTSTSTTSTTSATTTPTTTVTSPTTTTAKPGVSAVGAVFRDGDVMPVILNCNAGTHAPPLTWSRLENDYDHSDTQTYTEDGHGVLVIMSNAQSLAVNGVYQCHVAGGSANETAQFAVYKEIPGSIDCHQEFDLGNATPGLVLRTTCGPCQKSPLRTTELIWRDQICNSAMMKGLIPLTGGEVTWLMKDNNKVALLKEENRHIVLVT